MVFNLFPPINLVDVILLLLINYVYIMHIQRVSINSSPP